ncbi:MAG: DUF6492 family protein [Rikenellaceae bacterium]|nr:DUF6492 family protein [Rikenellaceae bacterium]
MTTFRDYLRNVFYQFYKLTSRKYVIPAKDAVIDVIIPFLEPDAEVLPLCIQGVRNCVNHKIDKVYVVSPETDLVKRLCGENDAVFVDETQVLGYGPEAVSYHTDTGEDRSGWIFQQLLKLSGEIGENRYFLVIDADHVLVRPHTFIAEDGRFVFYRSSDHSVPYYNTLESLTGFTDYGFFTFSYVSRKMIFDKNILAELRGTLADRSGKKWDRAIIEALESGELSTFSEFELYGNFVPDDKKISLPWRTKVLSSARLAPYESLVRRYSSKYLALTFPDSIFK